MLTRPSRFTSPRMNCSPAPCATLAFTAQKKTRNAHQKNPFAKPAFRVVMGHASYPSAILGKRTREPNPPLLTILRRKSHFQHFFPLEPISPLPWSCLMPVNDSDSHVMAGVFLFFWYTPPAAGKSIQ